MATQYNIYQYLQGINGFGLPFCDTIYSATLSANTDTTLTVPSSAAMGAPTATTNNKYVAIFSFKPASLVYVALGATAVVPAGSSFALASSELNPIAKVVKTGDVLHFITAGTGNDVTVAFYTIQD
jgi:hypothetical protein